MNTIIVIIDSLRKDHVGAYGNDWIKTPNLDEFARSGFVFESAYPESLPTIPVRRALHTGIRTFPYHHYRRFRGDRVSALGWRPIPEEQVTLSEILKGKCSITTGFVTDTYHQFKPSMNFHRGFDQFTWIRGQETDCYRSGASEEYVDGYLDSHLFSKPGFEFRSVPVLARYCLNIRERGGEEDYFAPRVFTEAAKWLEENSAEDFFLVVDSFDPHEPWDPPEEYRRLYPGAKGYTGNEVITPTYSPNLDPYTPDELEYMRACYAGEVTMVDKWFGMLLDKLDTLGLTDDTVVWVVSDHGHQLGHHGFVGKVPWGLFPELVDLVFMVRGPGVARARSSQLVYNLDLVPTVLRFHGVDPGNYPDMDGRDLTPLLTGEGVWTPRDHVTTGFNSFVFARDGKWGYIVDCSRAREQLFDLEADPGMYHEVTDPAVRGEACDAMFARVLRDAGGEEGLRRVRELVPFTEREAAAWYEMDGAEKR
ncbi:MAG: sulfatase [Promethearchaeota archaeon]